MLWKTETSVFEEMNELRQIAMSYYYEGSSEVKAKAHSFFNSMDVNGDGRVNLEEFLEFMRRQGYTHMRNNYFFGLLDRRGKGKLYFADVMTLYYIIKSGRPFCNCCGEFIPTVFFSCVACFNASPRASFTICHPCHTWMKSAHAHFGRRAFFLDNYTLMQAITLMPNPVSASTSTQYTATSFTHDNEELNFVDEQQLALQIAGTSQRHQNMMKVAEIAFKALEGALAIGNVFTTLATACTIM